MNYIILDLEWNQNPLGKESEEKQMPFEIIEIGAVKCDSNRNVISEFHEYIRPQVYLEFHHITQELLHINMNQLMDSDIFEHVINRFFEWCGQDYIFCTWGAMDLTELQKNLSYYGLNQYFSHAIQYYDIQKLFSICYEEQKISRTLEYAINILSIPRDYEFHMAINDARYTASIFRGMDIQIVEKNLSIDCYLNPKTKKEEIYIEYEHYSKYISREFRTKEELFADRDMKSTVCHKCHKVASKRMKWFSVNAKFYYCIAYCKTHGYIKGKIRIKRTDSKKYYGIKTLKFIDDEQIQEVINKKQEVQRKRKEKRNKKKQ